jgi:glycosyltransferase involved in cell wall biosynthesis
MPASTTPTATSSASVSALLVADAPLRAAMGRNGRHYIRQNYRWDVILGKYERMFAKLRQGKR